MQLGHRLMFGYRLEEDFDLAKEQRRDRLWWVITTLLLCLVIASFIRPFPAYIFQGYLLTSLFYGDSLYVKGKHSLGEAWFWKAIIFTVPIHAAFLAGIVGLDLLLPNIFTKMIIWMSVLAITFGFEAVLFEELVERLTPVNATVASAASAALAAASPVE